MVIFPWKQLTWHLFFLLKMPNTYTQLHVQFVFAVKYRASLIQKAWKENLHGYVTGIIQESEHKMLQINSMPDHIHIFIGMRPHQSISSLVQNVKTESTKYIKKQEFCQSAFSWQVGYGAFSYSKSHVQNVIRYVQNQEAHHKKQTFLNEYRKLLKAFEIEYDERYILKNRSKLSTDTYPQGVLMEHMEVSYSGKKFLSK
jgi:putative transposase